MNFGTIFLNFFYCIINKVKNLMAKVTFSDLTSAFASTTALNAKFQQIEDEFANKVVYRDEVSPMERDLDVNGFNILNVNNITATGTPSINADNVVFTPTGNISATDAQSALVELDSEKSDKNEVILNADITPTEGILRKTGVGTYTAHKTNLSASGAPSVNDDSSAGYTISSLWIDTTNDDTYICTDDTVGAAVWVQSGTSTPGGVSSVAATAPIVSSGGAIPTISINPATESSAGSLSSTDKMKIDAVNNGFYAHKTSGTPDMVVTIDPGRVYYNNTLLEIAEDTKTVVAPSTNLRIDRIVIQEQTGIASIIQGAEAASPVPPAIPSGFLPCCRIGDNPSAPLQPSTTVITNDMIDDERALWNTNDHESRISAIEGSFASGTTTISSVANNAFGTAQVAHGLGDVDVDFGATVINSTGTQIFHVMGIVRFASGATYYQTIYTWPTVAATTLTVPFPITAGNVGFSVRNESGTTANFTINWWVRAR